MGKFTCPSCKYEHIDEWKDNRNVAVLGDEAPIHLYLSNSIKVSVHTEDYEEKKVNLIACPKCKTVIIED